METIELTKSKENNISFVKYCYRKDDNDYLSVFTFPDEEMEFDFFGDKEHVTIPFIPLKYCQGMGLRE